MYGHYSFKFYFVFHYKISKQALRIKDLWYSIYQTILDLYLRMISVRIDDLHRHLHLYLYIEPSFIDYYSTGLTSGGNAIKDENKENMNR